ncbi:MAG: glycosyltransferase, partial [Rhodothermales bacterium]|nr:glycosyltransferase [Rhodothermales bacterium]
WDGLDPAVAEGFAGWQALDAPAERSTGAARALAVRHVRAPVVVFAEDHCFPEPDWAASLLAAHGERVAVVGPTVANANPATATSWADFFLNFGPYTDHAERADRGHVAWHNGAYRREVLLDCGGDLPRLLEVEGLLHERLRERGLELVQEPEARVRHLNFSRPAWMLVQQFVNGRQFGAARSEAWSPLRRLAHAAVWPAAAARQYGRVMREVRRAGRQREVGPRAFPILALALATNGLGLAAGYAFGLGRTNAYKYEMEFDRRRFMTRRERAAAPPDFRGRPAPDAPPVPESPNRASL